MKLRIALEVTFEVEVGGSDPDSVINDFTSSLREDVGTLVHIPFCTGSSAEMAIVERNGRTVKQVRNIPIYKGQ